MFEDRLFSVLGRIWEFLDGSAGRVAAHPKKNPQFILYMMKVSPYSRRVLRALDRAGYGVEIRDVIESEQAFQELMRGGKRDQVPCLRIRAHEKSTEVEDQWIYESKDIIAFLLKG